MDYLSLLVPFAYIGILVGSMATFSYLYRSRQQASKLRLAPYFPPHQARNIYMSLLHLPDQDPSVSKVPDSVLRAALLQRAVEDIHRIMEVRTRKPALQQLVQRGVVGDEMLQRLVRAEQELEFELKDVVAEANALAAGWGQTIFQSAGEMAQNKILREKLDKIKATIPTEQAAWEAQRERSRRELEGEPLQSRNAVPDAAMEKIPPKPGSSDEDGVIVDTPDADAASTMPIVGGGGGGGGGAGGKKNKKKNKK